jgi:peroxiredoxin Q/BCP
MPKVGELAPDFEAPTAPNGSPLKLSQLRGKPVVLYFYPEADTPGCTTESKGFRDHYPEFRAKNVEVVGVSVDDVQKQCDFAEKYSLPFPLVADTSKSVAKAYGALRESGRARRVTFLIGPDGRIMDIVDVPKADPHVARARELFLGR